MTTIAQELSQTVGKARAVVHYGQAEAVRQQRQAVLAAAYARHPRRFVRGQPVVRGAPDAVWINPPIKSNLP